MSSPAGIIGLVALCAVLILSSITLGIVSSHSHASPPHRRAPPPPHHHTTAPPTSAPAPPSGGGGGRSTLVGFVTPRIPQASALTTVQGSCADRTCDDVSLRDLVCSAGSGFTLQLVGFQPAPNANAGAATYTYDVCSPPAGTCTLDARKTCLDNSQCVSGPNNWGTCTRQCAVDKFHALSHVDVVVPGPTALAQCVTNTTLVSVSCSSGSAVIGDGSCDTQSSNVVKCENPNLLPGQCVTVTVTIAGEGNSLGVGLALLVDKAGNECIGTCIGGPSCEPCDDEPPPAEDRCLTRTRGFWGTHPWITNNYTPVSVCGRALTCAGPATLSASPNSCTLTPCNSSVMEALGSNGPEYKACVQYAVLVAQLTAARLNLAATAAVYGSAHEHCTSWRSSSSAAVPQSIAQVIAQCEALGCACSSKAQSVALEQCVAQLDEFNNSPDALGPSGSTPAPFDRPSIDDSGAVSGADPTAFTQARRTRRVIGRAGC